MTKPKLTLLVIALTLLASTLLAQVVIHPGDTIRVWVKGEAELTVERVVDSTGSIDMPLLESVGVAGLSPYAIGRVVTERLKDGYLKEPLVQVSVIARASRSGKVVPRVSAPPALHDQPAKHLPLNDKLQTNRAPTQFRIVDRETGKGIGGAAMMMGEKIFQSNRIGQIIAPAPQGKMILMADGYELVEDSVDRFLGGSGPVKISMKPVKYAESISITVKDAATGKPIADVRVKLDAMMVRTNRKGIFRIRKIKREYGELLLAKSGYKSARKLIDFKGPEQQTIRMTRSE